GNTIKQFVWINETLFCIEFAKHHKEIKLYVGKDPFKETTEFTLSTSQDFEAFKSYLDKYIAHYSKPEPKVVIVDGKKYKIHPVNDFDEPHLESGDIAYHRGIEQIGKVLDFDKENGTWEFTYDSSRRDRY